MAQFSAPVLYNVLQIPTSTDYTSKDYVGLRTSMLAFAKQVMPDWNSSSEGDMGVMFVELFAYAGDILSYYGDRISQEAYIGSATQRLSLINIASLLGYVISNGTAATGYVTFMTANPGVAVVVPAGTKVATAFNFTLDQPIIYETNSTITVAANGGWDTVAVTQGQTQSMVFLGTSTGASGQTFTLPQKNVLDHSSQIFVQEATGNVEWTQVTYLVNSGPNDQVYQVATDQAQNTIITFGDNINGLIPPVNLSIYCTYRIGNGSAGNQPAGAVGVMATTIPGVFVPFVGKTGGPYQTGIPGVSYQSSVMAGGSDPETNDQIRTNAPAQFQTQERAVAPSDYVNLAINVPGVIAANAVANHSTSVSLYVLGPGGTPPTTALQDAVLAYFTGLTDGVQKTLAGVSLSVLPPALIPIDVGSISNPVQLYVQPNYSQAVVTANVKTALIAFLTPPSVSFGALINLSQLFAAINAVAGVGYAVVPTMTREDILQTGTSSIQLRPSEVPVPGNIFLSSSGGF